jgi:hypothetical protein
MSVTIPTKDVGEVREKFSGEFKKGLEDCNEDYIKGEMRYEIY